MTLRERLRRILDNSLTERVITALIIVNAITLGLETNEAAVRGFGRLLMVVDRAILAIFVIEIAARLFVRRLAFFRDPWSLFDFAVVAVAILPTTQGFSVLRALRILRVLRLITFVPSLRRVVGALVGALPGMGSIFLLLALVYYVFSVMATKLFAASFPDWFGDIAKSAYTLFQVMTLESWSMGIVRPVMDVYPYAWAFFIPFILCTTFTVLNLFIGIIVSAMQSEHDSVVAEELKALEAERSEATGDRQHAEEQRQQLLAGTNAVQEELAALRADVAALRQDLARREA